MFVLHIFSRKEGPRSGYNVCLICMYAKGLIVGGVCGGWGWQADKEWGPV